jgi:hypothetical protein
MNDNLKNYVEKYGRKGVIVDTNMLLLYAVGTFDIRQIGKFKRTQIYEKEDFRLLFTFLKQFNHILTTPNILTELTNLTENLNYQTNELFFQSLTQQIEILEERYIETRNLAKTKVFVKFGLSDSAIAELGEQGFLVLTDDLKLFGFLSSKGIDCLNFNHIRSRFNN